jgi:chromate transporter
LAALVIVTVTTGSLGQIAAIVVGGCAGMVLCRGQLTQASGQLPAIPVSRAIGIVLLSVFAILLLVPSALPGGQGLQLFDALYRSGALVFGGGHVVLPLLREAVITPGWVSSDTFLAGYGAAQAVPGPLFTFAAYLGAVMGPTPNGILGAIIALLAIFIPGLLLVTGALPFWDTFRQRPTAQAVMRGTNAAVVGVLGAALFNPVWTSAVATRLDFAIAAAGFVLLTVWRLPPLAAVAGITAVAATAHILI